jgi:predicted dienelactone hydrolase
MRTIETLLLLANLLAFFVLALPLPRGVRWMRHLAPIALPIAVAQVLVEGSRWQMAPAYVLAGLFFVVWVLRSIVPVGGSAGKKRTNRLAVGLAIGLGVLGLAVSVALPMVVPVFRFPHPSGPYRIGTLTYHWVDADRPEVFTAEPGDRRELMVQIWYPAEGDPSSPRAPYIQDANAVTSALARIFGMPEFLFGNLKHVTTSAIPSAPMADDDPGYPVLVFLEGLGGFRQMNTFQVEELVSHGYVVVAIDQPYTAAAVIFPDGRQAEGLSLERTKPLVRQSYLPAERAPTLNGRTFQEGIIPYLAQDVSFALDRLAALNRDDPNGILTGRLDLRRAGAFGVSLGGIVAGEACRLEPRLQACLVMDAAMPADVVRAGLEQPTMWITRPADTMRLERRRAGGWPEAEIHAHQTTMRAVFEGLPKDGYFVRVPRMFHLNPTDYPSWSPLFRWLGVVGPIDERRAHSIVNAYSLAFFDRHLKDRPAALLDGPAEQYPEVLLETRRPSPSQKGGR